MGGISTGVGLISGIDTAGLIDQLIQLSARPRTLAQQRVVVLQAQQTALLDLNTRLGALKSAATTLGTQRLFQSAAATSSAPEVLSATASAGASLGSYQFIVDRLVSSQQVLSRGFVDRDTSPIGAQTFIFEGTEGRLDRDVALNDLNDGAGISRGRINITDSTGTTSTIDLSRVTTVDEVLDAINADASLGVTATVAKNSFIITDDAGGTLTVENDSGSADVLASLGFTPGDSGTSLIGTSVFSVNDNTTITSLNDGNGVRITNTAGADADFVITTRDGIARNVRLADLRDGEDLTDPEVTTVAALRARIESQTDGNVTVEIGPGSNGFRLVDQTGGTGNFEVLDRSGAAVDLGFVGTDGGTTSVAADNINGSAVLATINSTLLKNILGGSGFSAGDLTLTDGGGGSLTFNLTTDGSVENFIREIESVFGGDLDVQLDETGTGLVFDYSGTSDLTLSGGLADDLGLTGQTLSAAADPLETGRLQHAYVTLGTSLDTLNEGRGVGTGEFRITDGSGAIATIRIQDIDTTIGDVVKRINDSTIAVNASINAGGDGIVITDSSGGTLAMSIEDVDGSVAENLRFAGTAEGTGTDNFLDGSFETVLNFEAGATLDDIVLEINNSNAGVRADILNDGSGSNPFRLNLSSRTAGTAGRFTLDTGNFDLGATALSAGDDSRVFFGSDDAATGLLITGSSNTVDGAITGVSIDLTATSDTPVSLTVTRDNQAIEAAIGGFVSAFNDIVARIDLASDYDEETNTRAALFGDSTVRVLRQGLFSTLQSPAKNVSGPFQYLTQVGIKIASGGTIEFDAERFRTALEQDPDAVAAVFSAKTQVDREAITEISPGITVTNTDPAEFSSLGVAELIAQFADRYVDPIDGVLSQRDDSIDAQIRLQNERIDNLTGRLERERSVLENQFVQMERALQQLQSQQSALISLTG